MGKASLQWRWAKGARVSTTGFLIDSKIIYFGGYDGVHWMNDINVFDIESNYWEIVVTSEFKPRPRYRHKTNIVKGHVYIRRKWLWIKKEGSTIAE